MTNETKIFAGTQKTLMTSGASIANNALAQATTANYAVVADGLGYPDAEFVLSATFATAPTEGATLALYCAPQDIDGTNDAQVPEATRPTVFIGVFVVNDVTSAQYIPLNGIVARDVPLVGSYYLHNNGTGQSVSAGWTLKVTPRTKGPV